MFESNFRFLAEEWPSLATLGELAERYMYADPNSTLIKLRILCERLVISILAHEKIEAVASTQESRINLLHSQDLLDNAILSRLHNVRRKGNLAAHEGHDSYGDALEQLKNTYEICVWFMQNYGDWKFEAKSFIMPPREFTRVNSDNEIDKLIKAYEISEVSDDSRLAQLAADDTLKIGKLVQSTLSSLINENRLTDSIVSSLVSPYYCKSEFNINFAFLKKIDPTLPLDMQRKVNGYPRYYKTIYSINGQKYFLCNDWYERNKTPLLSWLAKVDSGLYEAAISSTKTEDSSGNEVHKIRTYQHIGEQRTRDKINKVAYYLSRFDHESIFPNNNSSEAISILSEILNVKSNTLKNKRDSFDPYCNELKTAGTKRKGWWQKALNEEMQKIFDEYRHKSPAEIEAEVKIIIGM